MMKHFNQLITEAEKFVVMGFNSKTKKEQVISKEFDKIEDAQKYMKEKKYPEDYINNQVKIKKVIKTYK